MNLLGNGIGLVPRVRPTDYRRRPASHETGVKNGSHGHDLVSDNGALLSTNSLLQNIGNEHLVRLRPFLKRVNLARAQYLYQQDDRVDSIFFPETAVISEFQILEDGRMIEVGIVGVEGAVGIASAFSESRAVNCTQVSLAGTAILVGRDLFEREVVSDRSLQLSLHNYINTQIKHLSQRVVCNTFHSVEQRFCTWLLTLQNRSRRNRFRVTHEHVARALGVHRPSVTCIAQSLREKHLIDYGRARLVISDRAGLERLACGCSSEINGVYPSH